jgi:predicted GH43/DUF377 family glycosyl hydrolase
MTEDWVPLVERLHGGLPLLKKVEIHPWENKVTFNPACVLVGREEGLRAIVDGLPLPESTRLNLRSYPALVFVLYRAQGRKAPERDYTRSAIGLAVCSPELELLARLDRPVFVPEAPYEDLGVEDPRVTFLESRYVMVYTAYASGMDRNRVRIAVASTTDFVQWTRHGLLKGTFNTIDNKNGMIFPQIAGHSLLMLHRPMEGEHPMKIHWAESGELLGEWRSRGVLMAPLPNPDFKDVWIGGGAPPLRLEDGRCLILYHTGNRDRKGAREYDLGLALLDPASGEPIVRRVEPLLRPETRHETNGDADLGVNNVVFVCGAYFWKGALYFPYAGADSCVLAGRIPRPELAKFLQKRT